MNITLSLDDELIKKVRKIAVERDTTMASPARDYLEQLAVEDAASGRRRREREGLEATVAAYGLVAKITTTEASRMASSRRWGKWSPSSIALVSRKARAPSLPVRAAAWGVLALRE
jgi:hypothetical protein